MTFPVIILANSADPDEMQHNAAFHLSLHCLPMYPFKGFQYTMGYKSYECLNGIGKEQIH